MEAVLSPKALASFYKTIRRHIHWHEYLFLMLACWAYFSVLKMEAMPSSETSVICWTAQRHIPEHVTLQFRACLSKPEERAIIIDNNECFSSPYLTATSPSHLSCM
jgi:hypothetical protein